MKYYLNKPIRSKKGKPVTFCKNCKEDTVDVLKMGGIICSQCRSIKCKTTELDLEDLKVHYKINEV